MRVFTIGFLLKSLFICKLEILGERERGRAGNTNRHNTRNEHDSEDVKF